MRARYSAAALVAAVAGNALPVLAQCSMCRTALAAQGPEAADAFNRAILILLVPAVVLFSSVFLLVFRLREPADGDEWKK